MCLNVYDGKVNTGKKTQDWEFVSKGPKFRHQYYLIFI